MPFNVPSLTTLASESARKEFVLSSWLFLGRPAVNASGSNCAHFLDARLELFWAEDWSALWATVRAECDIAPVQNATRRTTTQQRQSRVRKVATSARTGEKGRALAAARNAPPIPVTEQIVQEIKSFYPTDPEPQLLRRPSCQAYSCQKWLSTFLPHFAKCHDSMNQDHTACARNIGMTLVSCGEQQLVCASSCPHCSSSNSTLSSTAPQGRTDHTTRQTHRWPQTTSHDVLFSKGWHSNQ